MTTLGQLALAHVAQGRPVRVAGKKRGKQPKPAASFEPHRCVVLGIDPGAMSGWAVLVAGQRAEAGTARGSDDRRAAVVLAQQRASEAGLPLVVVAETWSAGGWGSHTTLLGLGAAWGAWLEQLEELGVPKRARLRVLTQTWRSKILGGTNRRGPRDWKAEARAWARAAHGLDVGPDVAEALAIAAWGSRAGEVLERLPSTTKGRRS